MKKYIRCLSFLLFALSFSNIALSHDLKGKWVLKIENKKHQPITTLEIKFITQEATSCIAGDWSRVIVLSSITKDKNFFPISDLLSYSIEKNHLTIGRVDICDGYLMLRGVLEGKMIRGKYYSLGMGGPTTLGFFSLHRNK